MEENIALARLFLLERFVSRGMVVDFTVHVPDAEPGGIFNPHFHVMSPIRPIKENGKRGCKQHRVNDLGRIVIPKEIRRTLHIREGDPLHTALTSFDLFLQGMISVVTRITGE